ncbi:hypothetical protein R69746_05772 [Paraburkholderia aspalathi]|uniref:DUF4376 domain-containing protein n=1 Tax=Paraburkholderia aspalathi TaxID=1324617 RepID=UPI00190CB563|nr:hypothetical protein [Paraburkholderia aspalathi]MBK3841869.1 hypothetical protein [Paraburkholderia aspalathi]CAE6814504.1 hypothetical protein R69746_05772 [Paraburkholderia aspalathi]
MNVYHYDPATGEYVGESQADESPLEAGVHLIPAYATDIAPPACANGQIAVFRDGNWVSIEDHRGETYWLADGTEHTVDTPGPLPEGALTEAPLPPLNKAQAAKLDELAAACQAVIYAGFVSSALGTPYTYPAKDTDQQNLSASVLASLLPNLPAQWTTAFWCADANANWSLATHTAAQIQQVGMDGMSAISNAIAKKARLEQQVAAAATVEAVRAVVWS